MTMRNAKPLLAVLGYFALSFCGFSLLYRWGVPYNGGTIHIYAIPMMLLMALYVCWVNGGQPLHRRDFVRRKGDLGLFLLPYLALLMVAASSVKLRSSDSQRFSAVPGTVRTTETTHG